jgi:hypothetical protein
VREGQASAVDGFGGVETSGSHTRREGCQGIFILFGCYGKIVNSGSNFLQEKLIAEGRGDLLRSGRLS